jgi:hypothetical protein
MKDRSSSGSGCTGGRTMRRPLSPAGADAVRELKYFLMKPMRDRYRRARSLWASLYPTHAAAPRVPPVPELNPQAEYGIMYL